VQIETELFKSISMVFGSLTKPILDKLMIPCSRYYLRVNTMIIDRGELLDLLCSKYTEYTFNPDPYYNDAIYIIVKGPYKIPIVDKKIVVDYIAAESIMLGAPVYRPGIIKFDTFRPGEEVNIITPNGLIVALAKTTMNSKKVKQIRKGLVAKNIVSRYRLPPIREMLEYKAGLFYPQSLPSIAVTHILSPEAGETIIDCCAAPGGKTSHIIQYSRGLVRLISIDRSIPKINKIIETITRLRLPKNYFLYLGDSRYLDSDLSMIKADKILIDPPCTALGIRPKLLFTKTYKDLLNSVAYQRQFFKPAYNILKVNGILVYSTCTITFHENEGNCLYIRDLGFETVDVEVPYADKVYLDNMVFYRFSPLSHDMNGYFIAVFKKISS